MAGASAKKIASFNATALNNLRMAGLGVLLWQVLLSWVLLPLVLGWATPGWFVTVLTLFTWGIVGVCYWAFLYLARDNVSKVTEGMGQYTWDVVLISLLALLLCPFTVYSWWLLLLIPLYAAWKAFGLYFQVAHSSKGMPAADKDAPPTKAELRAQKKLEKKQRGRVIYSQK